MCYTRGDMKLYNLLVKTYKKKKRYYIFGCKILTLLVVRPRDQARTQESFREGYVILVESQ